jgi:hypothetical protein
MALEKDADVKIWVTDGKQTLHILKTQLKKYKAMGFKESITAELEENK